MLGGGAVAVVAVSRADAMPVLGDLSGHPLCAGKGGDDIADQLRLADAAGVPADNNDAPARRADSFIFQQT